MRLQNILLGLGILCIHTFAKAQDTLSYESFKEVNPVEQTLQRDTITIIDSVVTTSFVNEKEQFVHSGTKKDSITFRLPDEPLAARMGSLWRREFRL